MNSTTLKTERLHDEFNDPAVLTHIYNAEVNLAVWDRTLDDDIVRYSQLLCREFKSYQMRFSGNISAIEKHLKEDFPIGSGRSNFINDVTLLVDMFSELLDLKEVGIRFAVLTKAMCPKFHVDRVPVRLITTYWGNGTEWMENAHVNRNELGFIEVPQSAPIHHLYEGQVGLMKGESWEGNEGGGLVHRSAKADVNSPRCVLTLDCIS